MACAICKIRRPRRFCPGVRGDICSICCGTEREVTVDCPLDCEYLQEAHKHEKPRPLDMASMPNQDIEVSEEFLAENEEFLIYLSSALTQAAVRTPETIDFDVREALDSAIQTQRTAQSGLIYESLPSNPVAARLTRTLLDAITEFRKDEFERLGIHKTREGVALKLLVFLQHFERSYNNGRRKGRAFIDAARTFYPVTPESNLAPPSSLIVP